MGELLHARRLDEKHFANSISEDEGFYAQAVVPTIDVYTAKVMFCLTQKMIEDTVDKRITSMEKNIEKRDQEVMRMIRRVQAQVVIQQSHSSLPWWKKIFKHKRTPPGAQR